MLRATYFRAVDEGMAPYQPRLFKGVYTGTKVTVKRAVDEDVFRRLDTPVADESLESARLLFLLLFMLRGMPFVDIAYLRHCDLHDNVIVYRRKKTGAWLTVRVEAKAMEIIRSLRNADGASPYLFPLIHHPGKDEYRQYQNALRGFIRAGRFLLFLILKITVFQWPKAAFRAERRDSPALCWPSYTGPQGSPQHWSCRPYNPPQPWGCSPEHRLRSYPALPNR